MRRQHRRAPARWVQTFLLVLAVACTTPACGAGGGDSGDSGGGDLVLLELNVSSLDNVPINRRLRLAFSEAVDPASVMVTDPNNPAYGKGSGSIQIRKGEAFGLTAAGTFHVEGAVVYFDPVVPGRCDLVDAGLQPGTTYRVTVLGGPEEFSVRSRSGNPLEATASFEFTTLGESDPDYLEDQAPGQRPSVLDVEPAEGSAAVPVEDGNRVTIRFSENLDPCSVSEDTVRLYMAQTGDPTAFVDAGGGRASGFSPVQDADPDPWDWGSTLSHVDIAPVQRVPCSVVLEQDLEQTVVSINPHFGRFPENALLVVDMSLSILDFEGYPLSPTTISFTTENLPTQTSTNLVDFDRSSTPVDDVVTTADVDTDRSPGRAQGWLLFAGDGDNGEDVYTPSYPSQAMSCTWRPNHGGSDAFDPQTDVVLDTGSTRTDCVNGTDGSHAVVWEFASFRIRPGVTVRILGLNPAILLVRGDVLIESGGKLLARGSGASDPNGGNAVFVRGASPPTPSRAGVGVAGGGDGGLCRNKVGNYGEDGRAGYGAPDPFVQGGHGAGQGGVGVTTTTSASGGAGGGGGGGGHAGVGDDGLCLENPNAYHVDVPRSQGGGYYGSDRMYKPSAGSGGGAGGYLDHSTWFGSDNGNATGGGGGAGGGFVDITASGDIRVYGTIDVSGGNGGNGIGIAYKGTYLMHTGTGGGGSGGGIRLLTPQDMDVTGAILTAAGGSHGVYPPPPYWQPLTVNHGGDGSSGRIVLEDADSVIQGQGSASLVPSEGVPGFYRSAFDPNRFAGGSGVPIAVTGPLFLGSMGRPTFLAPVAEDFVAGIPSVASRGQGRTSLVLECQGFGMLPTGEPDLESATGWTTLGFFRDSGAPDAPEWVGGANPGDVTVPADNEGAGVAALNGCTWFRIRVSMYLPTGLSPRSPGPFIDEWTVRFRHDQ